MSNRKLLEITSAVTAAENSLKFLEQTIVMVEANRSKFEHIDTVGRYDTYQDILMIMIGRDCESKRICIINTNGMLQLLNSH